MKKGNEDKRMGGASQLRLSMDHHENEKERERKMNHQKHKNQHTAHDVIIKILLTLLPSANKRRNVLLSM